MPVRKIEARTLEPKARRLRAKTLIGMSKVWLCSCLHVLGGYCFLLSLPFFFCCESELLQEQIPRESGQQRRRYSSTEASVLYLIILVLHVICFTSIETLHFSSVICGITRDLVTDEMLVLLIFRTLEPVCVLSSRYHYSVRSADCKFIRTCRYIYTSTEYMWSNTSVN